MYSFDPAMGARSLTANPIVPVMTHIYDALGNEIHTVGSITNTMRYGGQVGYYKDQPYRLYVRARHLDVVNGRWLSRDPVGGWQSPNAYEYVGNRPTTVLDPTGRGAVGLTPTCALVCALNIPCGINLAIQCGYCGVNGSCWWSCVQGIVDNLPWWLKPLCLTPLLACIMCLNIDKPEEPLSAV